MLLIVVGVVSHNDHPYRPCLMHVPVSLR